MAYSRDEQKLNQQILVLISIINKIRNIQKNFQAQTKPKKGWDFIKGYHLEYYIPSSMRALHDSLFKIDTNISHLTNEESAKNLISQLTDQLEKFKNDLEQIKNEKDFEKNKTDTNFAEFYNSIKEAAKNTYVDLQNQLDETFGKDKLVVRPVDNDTYLIQLPKENVVFKDFQDHVKAQNSLQNSLTLEKIKAPELKYSPITGSLMIKNMYEFGSTSEKERIPGKIYINPTRDGLLYEVLDKNNKLNEDIITEDKLPEEFSKIISEEFFKQLPEKFPKKIPKKLEESMYFRISWRDNILFADLLEKNYVPGEEYNYDIKKSNSGSMFLISDKDIDKLIKLTQTPLIKLYLKLDLDNTTNKPKEDTRALGAFFKKPGINLNNQDELKELFNLTSKWLNNKTHAHSPRRNIVKLMQKEAAISFCNKSKFIQENLGQYDEAVRLLTQFMEQKWPPNKIPSSLEKIYATLQSNNPSYEKLINIQFLATHLYSPSLFSNFFNPTGGELIQLIKHHNFLPKDLIEIEGLKPKTQPDLTHFIQTLKSNVVPDKDDIDTNVDTNKIKK